MNGSCRQEGEKLPEGRPTLESTVVFLEAHTVSRKEGPKARKVASGLGNEPRGRQQDPLWRESEDESETHRARPQGLPSGPPPASRPRLRRGGRPTSGGHSLREI
jgi:hypothetical protein